MKVAERIRRTIEDAAIPHEAGEAGRVTVSLGLSAGTTAESTSLDLIVAADAALYAAKRNGRNCVWPPRGCSDDKVTPLLRRDRSRFA